jgi:uncharacterized protein (TIGR02147 family)
MYNYLNYQLGFYSAGVSMDTVFEYVNYRHYLKDFLREAKRNKLPEYAHKVILNHLGTSSTGFLSNVIAGRKNLTSFQIRRMAQALKLNKTEEAYFDAMVHFTQAKVLEEKNEYFNRMVLVQKLKMKVLDKKKMTLFSKWYYVFVRELLNFHDFKDDTKALARLIIPPIKSSEAKEAINFLEELGLIKKDAQGFYRQTENAITSGDEVRSLDLARFQLATIDLAKRALQKIPSTERDLSVLTMTLSVESFKLIKSELQKMRKRFANIAVEEKNPDQVYQMNIQFFPVTRKKEPLL